jgi:hypothetical protein
MYTLNVPLCDWNDYLKSSLHNFSSVSTVNSCEKGGRTVGAASSQVTLNTSHCGILNPHWHWKQMAESCVMVGCIISRGVKLFYILGFLYVLRDFRP